MYQYYYISHVLYILWIQDQVYINQAFDINSYLKISKLGIFKCLNLQDFVLERRNEVYLSIFFIQEWKEEKPQSNWQGSGPIRRKRFQKTKQEFFLLKETFGVGHWQLCQVQPIPVAMRNLARSCQGFL